ncbi:MAG TPA: hypothetical protein VGO36_06595 [Solirubrobacterales bacterium]|nr:hypothetical protein [Solirubrobacterales bacterium]
MSNGSRDSEAGRSSWWRWPLLTVAAVAVFGVGVFLRGLGSEDGGSSVLQEVSIRVHARLADHPRDAARAALAMERADPSLETEMAMFDVAVDGGGRERTVDTGSPKATAAAVLERTLVTAGSDGAVQVWDRVDGTLLGTARAPVPLAAIAASNTSSPFLAAVDEKGAVALVDTSDTSRPRVLALGPALAAGRPLAVSFSTEPVEVVAVGSGGEVLRVDAVTGKVRSRSSLMSLRGSLPWPPAAARLRLATARFVPESFEDDEGLLVATADGAVADLDLGRDQGKTLLEPGITKGRILSVDRVPYQEPSMLIGTSEGMIEPNESGYGSPFRSLPGPPVTAVAIGAEEGSYWSGGAEGLTGSDRRRPAGPPVLEFDAGYHGIAAIHPGGLVSVLGPPGTGLSLEEASESTVAAFDPDGHLLLAEGYDPSHIEEIQAVRPQPRLPGGAYQEEDVVRVYRPDPDWWPQPENEEEDDALYLNDVAADDEYVVAGGQGPDGEAAVMVWDAESGKPLHHLGLGTGGVSTPLPSIVSEVMLLPSRHEIAAYSTAQELLALWSTDTWELEDSVPVGAAADVVLSPDESTILAVGIDPDGEGYVEPNDPIELTFVDVGAAEVDHTVRVKGVVEAAFSPDGARLALADASDTLRFRTADGRQPLGPVAELDGETQALAWRPDAKLVAVSLEEGGVVLVDPDSGQASRPLPTEPYSSVLRLAWNPDGTRLAALTAEPDETDGEGYDPDSTAIWTLGREDLERRLCELAACRPVENRSPGLREESSRLNSVDLVYQQEDDLVAADLDGHTAHLAYLGEYASPSPAYGWSRQGFAWSTAGQIGFVPADGSAPLSWPCPCSGVAWDGGEIVSLTVDGGALIRIDPHGRSVRREPVRGVPDYVPSLVGVVVGQPVVSAYKSEPSRATPSALFELRGGTARQLVGSTKGSVVQHWPSESPDTLAFVSSTAGFCYSVANVGVISRRPGGELGVSLTNSPLGEDEYDTVRSVQVAADGSVSATIAPLGCDAEDPDEDEEPPGERYLLRDGRWRPTGEEGADVQTTREGTAVLEPHGERLSGDLALLAGDERLELAPEIEGLVARP